MSQIKQVKFDEELCKLYQKRYNANILELDDADKNSVKNICIAIMELGPSSFKTLNHSLFQLMYNKFIVNHQPIFKNILGPCSITLFQSKKYKKTIYVIGEIHCGKESPQNQLCKDNYVTAASMLDTISKNSTVFLDIYVEFPPSITIKPNISPYGFIGDIFKEGSKCFSEREKKIPACTTTRWHFSDIRFDTNYKQNTLFGVLDFDIGKTIGPVMNLLFRIPPVSRWTGDELSWSKLSEWCTNNEQLKEALKLAHWEWKNIKLNKLETFIVRSLGVPAHIFESYSQEFVNMMIIIGALQNIEVIKIIKIIREQNFDKLWDITKKMFLCKGYIKKEVDRSTIKEYLIEYNKRKFYDIMTSCATTTASDAQNFLTGGDNTYNRLFYFKNILVLLSKITSLQSDIYLLARIFKKFKVGKNQPVEPSNIITYTGNFHAKYLQEFFIAFDDFQKISEVINDTCSSKNIKNKRRSLLSRSTKFPPAIF